MIGCDCSVCRSENPRNMRLRTSARILIDSKDVIIDVTPDFREQALRYSIGSPAAVLVTHTHYDHIGGLEELRAYNIHTRRAIPCYLSAASHENVKKLFYYHFTPRSEKANFSAMMEFHVLPHSSGAFEIDGIPIQYFSYAQGNMPVTGFRIGSLAYITDIKQYDDSIFSHLEDLEVLVISAAWHVPPRMQFSLEEAMAFQQRVRASNTYCIHLSHDIDYDKDSPSLPHGVSLAYDGLKVDFSL